MASFGTVFAATPVGASTSTSCNGDNITFACSASTTFTVGTAGTYSEVYSYSGSNPSNVTFNAFTTGGAPEVLPSGLSFSIGGVISGTPAAGTQGTYTFKIIGDDDSDVTTTNEGDSDEATQWFTLTILPAPSTTGSGTTCSTPGTISAVGSLAQAGGTGITTLSVDPQNVGDAEVLAVGVFLPGSTVSSVSGGGATGWQQVSWTTADGGDTELWLGTVSSTGSSTITVTFSSSVSSLQTELDAQEFSSSIGATTTWALDVAGTASTTSSSTVVDLPTLAPTGTNELYVDYTPVDNTGVAGSTTGFTYDVTSTGSLFVYNSSVSASVSPTAAQTPAGNYPEAAALLTASASTTCTPPGGGSSTPPTSPSSVTVPAISLSKTPSSTTYNAVGQVITYTYVISNSGNVILAPEQYTVTDNLINGGVAFNCGSSQSLGLVNSTITCTSTYTITAADLAKGTVTNLATATNGGQTSPVATVTITATASTSTTIPSSPPKVPPTKTPPTSIPPIKIPASAPSTGLGGSAKPVFDGGLLSIGGSLILAGLMAMSILIRRRRA